MLCVKENSFEAPSSCTWPSAFGYRLLPPVFNGVAPYVQSVILTRPWTRGTNSDGLRLYLIHIAGQRKFRLTDKMLLGVSTEKSGNDGFLSLGSKDNTRRGPGKLLLAMGQLVTTFKIITSFTGDTIDIYSVKGQQLDTQVSR